MSASPLALVAVFGIIGLNLRTTFGAVPSLLDDVGDDLHLSGFALSLLTAIPVVCMGLLAPVAQRLAARVGQEQLTTLSLALLTIAEVMRLGGQVGWVLYLSTLLSGAAMGGVSTVMPGLIGHHLGRAPGLGAGIYSTAMATGSAIAAWLTVPLATTLGGWNRSLAFWAVPTAVTTLCWLLVVPRLTRSDIRGVRSVREPPSVHRLPWRSRTARLLGLYFAIQTLLGFSVLTWVAPAYRARGWAAEDAALLLSLLLVVQVVAMLVLPAITDRTRDRRPLLALALGSTALGLLCFAATPTLAYVAAALVGLGVGGGFSLGLVLLVDVTTNRAEAARLAAMVFLLSYTFAALGPLLVGVLHDLTGGFAVGFWALFALSVAHLAVVPGLRPGRTVADRLRPQGS